MAAGLDNNAPVPCNNTNHQYDDGDLVSIHNHTTPTGKPQVLLDASDRTNEAYKSFHCAEGGRTTANICTGPSESLQDRAPEMHIYEDPTDNAYISFTESLNYVQFNDNVQS